MHVPIKNDPYIEGIKGFHPYQPHVEFPTPKALIVIPEGCASSSLLVVGLNDEIFQWGHGEAEGVLSDENIYSDYEAYSTVIEPVPPAPIPPIPPPSVPEIGI